MPLNSPALQKAYDTLTARRSVRSFTAAGPRPAVQKHEALKLAFIPDGRDAKGDRYLLIRYCPGCLLGTVIDLVRELPDRTPNARDLGVKQAKPWRVECNA